MPRTKQFDREETLQKAMTVFWEKGYYGTSMQDLVDRMGINRSSLYDTFGEKHSLFKEALVLYKSKFGITDFYLQFESPRQGILQLIEDYTNSVVQDGENKGCFMLNSTGESTCHDPEIKDFLNTNLMELRSLLTNLYEKGKEMGEFDESVVPGNKANLLIASLQGMRMIARVESDKVGLRNLANQITETIV